MTLSEGGVARRCTIDGSQLTVLAADNFTRRLQTRGSSTAGGGWWGRLRATCGCGGSSWERQGKAEEGGEGSGGGGGGSNAEMVCGVCSRVLC
jgi:hypothetical protein